MSAWPRSRRQSRCEPRREVPGTPRRAYWDNLTPEQRSAEMKRRARVRNQNRARKSKSS
jgi:hypothetical protein